MQADGGEALGGRVVVSINGVRGGDVAGVGVRVAEEVGEGGFAEVVVVGVRGAEEFHHFADGGLISMG